MEKRKTTQCTERGQHKRCAHLCRGEAPCWRNYVCDPAKNKDCTGIPGGRCMIWCYNTLDKDRALIQKSCCKYGQARRIAGYCRPLLFLYLKILQWRGVVPRAAPGAVRAALKDKLHERMCRLQGIMKNWRGQV
ncbi:hypothetical protein MR942_09600 [bacterium]|nr:hypothetical protein [bacterium]